MGLKFPKKIYIAATGRNVGKTDFQKGKIIMVSPIDQIDRLFDSLMKFQIEEGNKWRIRGVLLTAGKSIPEGFLDLFESTGIPVLSTPLSKTHWTGFLNSDTLKPEVLTADLCP